MLPTSPASSRTEATGTGLSSIDARTGIDDLAIAASIATGAISVEDLARLHEVEVTLQADLPPAAMHRRVLEGALSLARATDGMLLLLDAEGLLRGAEAAGRANGADAAELAASIAIRVDGSGDILSKTLVQRKCFVFPARSPQDDSSEALNAALPASLPEVLRRGPLATVPLVAGTRVVGALALGARPPETALHLLRSFADSAARAIERAGTTDALRASHGRLREIVEQCTRDERRRNLLSSITEQSPDAILSVDRDGLVTSWNRGAERIFSIASVEILGKSWLTLAPPDREAEYHAMTAQERSSGAVSIDTFARTRTGSLLPVRLMCSPLDAGGNGQDGWSLILRDLTEQRSLAEVSERLREELYSRNRLEGIIGNSPAMDEVRDRIRRVARFNSSVLLVGESGTGKEVVANAIHYNSPRREKPFIKVNCAAIPESLLESELFGIERSVATGVDGRIGRFEMADGGTLFLDEIGDMSLATQAKILRVLQEREFERVGGKSVIKVDVRIIAATNKSLEKEIEARRFRNDLYYRLNVIVIALPPLAVRREDIDPLVDHFLEKFTRENGLQRRQMTLQARMLMNQYDWPGNVRELEHCIERAVVMSMGSEIVEADLPPAILIWKELGGSGQSGGEHRLSSILKQVERRTVLSALERSGWVQARAARVLGISERSMWYRVKKLGLKQG